MKQKLSIAFSLALILVMLLAKGALADTTPTIKSDLLDYGPGDTVILSGAGWQPGESVNVVVNDNVGQTWKRDVNVTAADDGTITDTFSLPSWFVATYYVSATGASGVANTSFTDGALQFVETGLPSGTSWSVTWNGVSKSSTTGTIAFGGGGSDPSHDYSVATISGGTGIQYVPSPATGSAARPATGNTDVPITFTTQYQVTFAVDPSSSGTTTPSATTWYNANAVINPLSAAAVSGYVFSSWSASSSSITFDNASSASTKATINDTGTITANFNISCTAPSVTTGPSAAIVTYGTDAIFTATGVGTLQWQVLSTASGAVWANITGGSPLTISTPTVAMNSYQYRAVFSACSTSATSTAALLTVNPKGLDITADNQSKTYGDLFTFTGNEFTTGAGQLVGSDAVTSVTLNSTGATVSATVAGSTYPIVASSAVGTGLGNYTITYHDGALTVNPKGLDITANNQSKTYGDLFTFTGTEFTTGAGQLVVANGDAVTSVTLNSTGAAVPATVAGSTYPIVASAAVGTGLGNYTITYHNGALTVNPKGLDITADNQSKTYGDLFTFAGTEFTTGSGQLVVANGDAVTSVTLNSTGATVSATVAGSTYPIVASSAVGTGLGNYTITYHDGALTVNTKGLDIYADNQSKTYGDLFTFTGTEFTTGSGQLVVANGDAVTSVTLNSTGAAVSATVAGSTYPIVASLAVGTGLDNYTITYHDGALTVNPALLTVTADDKTKILNALNPSFTFLITGFKNNETASVLTTQPSCSSTAGTNSPVGSYPITCSGGVADNYTFTYFPGTLKILFATGVLCNTGSPSHQILQPINSDGTSVWKVRNTVPVKFTVCDANGVPVSSGVFDLSSPHTLAVPYLYATTTVPNLAIDEVAVSNTPDPYFRWSSGQWIFNLNTDNLKGGTKYFYYIYLADGTKIQFSFGLKS